MLPTLTPELLTNNPNFAALHRDLCTNKLNPTNGSTRLPDVKERDAFNEELKKARVEAAKRSLVKGYLGSLAWRGDELPSDLQELVAIIAAALHGPASLEREDLGLLGEEVVKFKENVMLTSLVVSKAAAEDITSLARIFSSGDTGDWRDLPSRILRLRDGIASKDATLQALRLDHTKRTGEIHALYRQTMEMAIKILEQTIHGSVSRGTKAKADYLGTVAEGIARKLQIQQNRLVTQTRSPAMEEALGEQFAALERDEIALKRKIREAEDRLADYGEAKGLVGMADEYAQIVGEQDEVTADIERLRQRIG